MSAMIYLPSSPNYRKKECKFNKERETITIRRKGLEELRIRLKGTTDVLLILVKDRMVLKDL